MSESTARADRRSARRAFGARGVSLMEAHDQQVAILTKTITTLLGLVKAHEAILTRGVWGRLRWLVRGR